MAGQSATLGKLLVQLLLDDEDFHEGLKEAEVGVQRTVKKVGKLGGALKGALVTGFKLASAAALGLVAASAAVGSSFEKQMAAVASVRGITDLTGVEYEKLSDKARELGATTAFSATQAAEGMEALARAGLTTTEILAASSTALAFAGANSLDLGRSAEILAGSMAQFGIQAKDVTEIADVFTATAQNSLFSAEGLAQAMKFAGVQGSALGRDITEVSAAVAQFRDLGLEAGQAGTQYRNAMAALAKPTSEAKKAIKAMGLDLADVNPEMHSFDQIMKRLGESGLGTTEALAIFGKRTAAATLKVATSLATSTDEWDKLLLTLQQAQAEGALTAQTYDTMMNNVSGQMAILRSTTEELFITLFKSFAGPLRDLLAQTAEFVGAIAKELASRSLEIKSKFTEIFGTISTLMKENQKTSAAAFADWLVAMLDIARAMLPMIQGIAKIASLFTALIPILDEVFIILSTIFVAQKVLAFVTAIQAAIVVAGGLQAAMYGLAASITAATGGLNLVIGALAVAVIGLRLYWNATNKAAQATRSLKDAQDQLASEGAARQRQFEAIADRLLTTTKNEALALKERAANGEVLQKGLESELDTLLALDAAQAGRMISTGELVKVNGKLRTVQGAVMFEGQAGADLIKQKIESATAAVAGYEKKLEQASGGGIALANDALDRSKEKLFNLREGFIAAATTTKRFADAAAAAEAGIGAVGGAAADADEELEKLRKSQGKFANEATALFQDLNAELADTGTGDAIEAQFAARAKSIKKMFAEQIESEEATGARRLELESALQKTLSKLAEVESKARLNFELGAVEDQVDRAREILHQFRLDDMTDAEKLAVKRDDTLLGLADATAQQKQAIADEFNADIAKLEQGALDDAEEDTEERVGFWEKVGKAAVLSAEIAGRAWSGLTSIVEQISGFSFDLVGSVKEVIALQADAAQAQLDAKETLVEAEQKLADLMAAEKQDAEAIAAAQEELIAAQEASGQADSAAGANAGVFAKDFVQGLVDEAVNMAQVFAAAAGPLLNSLAEGIPVIMDAIVEALPVIAEAMAEAIPKILMAVVGALPALIPALVEALVTVFVAVIDVLPDLIIVMLTEVIPSLMLALVEALPTLITAIIGSIPEIIASIIMSLPKLVAALFVALMKGVGGIFKGIAEGIWNAIKNFFNIFKKKKDKDGKDKGKKGSFSGMSFVPATMRMTVHKGEAIIPADRNVEFGGTGPAPAGAGGGGGGGNQPIDIAVIAEGRVLDAVQVRAMKRGGAVGLQNEIRRSSGVKVGLDTGRFNPWSKA